MVSIKKTIHKLSPEIAEKIAAGEVVERPESIVKELLENSLDAGARSVQVALGNGGKDLIRVQDDGAGIEAGDLPLAVERHATSKISDAEDLYALHTYGFRGEALASIGAVAELSITSSTDGVEGAQVKVSGGRRSDVSPSACPRGTVVEVRNLFFSVPGRRKFLKRRATEFGRASEWVMRAALSGPATGFRLEHDGKLIWNVAPDTSFEERISIFYGPEVSQKLLRVNLEGAVSVKGVVARPEVSRRDGKACLFFVNGRSIRDKTLQSALREAFKGSLIPGRFPFAVLFVDIDPALIDVNVHPAKAEIRYQNGQMVFQAVFRAVKRALSTLGPRVLPTDQARGDARSTRAEAQAFFGGEGGGGGRRGWGAGGSFDRSPLPSPSSFSSPSGDVPSAGALPFAGGASQDRSGEDGASTYVPAKQSMQIASSYLVVETEKGLEIIDQHALHEKILYHEILARLKSGPAPAQRLLLPLTVQLAPEEAAACERYAEKLARCGFEIEPAGPVSVSLKTVPAFGKTDQPEQLFKDMLSVLREGSTETWKPAAQQMACKLAVKSGMKLTPEAQRDLLRRAEEGSDLDTCPHGRPTHLLISLGQLKKHFDRT